MKPAIVAIGRNEGERLVRSLTSAKELTDLLVYVDSGSTDDSVEQARTLGADVIELDDTEPFTAARGRNAGWRRVRELSPDRLAVQFIDGDCELDPSWLIAAEEQLESDSKLGAVKGKCIERHPEASSYNLLCNLEWNYGAEEGEVDAMGGNALLRLEALEAVGGYNAARIAGEEKDLSIRMKQQGWRLFHLDRPMVYHDADMHRFGQWWTRATRTGHAFAEIVHRYREAATDWQRSVRSILLWGLAIPLLAVVFALLTRGWGLLILGVYPLQMLRMTMRLQGEGVEAKAARVYAFFTVLGKIPTALGVLKFHLNRLRGRSERIIEYK